MPLRVLLVDDDPLSLALCRLALAELDERVVVDAERDGHAAIARMDEATYDVVISDQNMPRWSGIDVLAAARERAPDAMRVLISGADDPDVAREGMTRAGIHAFLAKPKEFSELRSELGALLEMRSLGGR